MSYRSQRNPQQNKYGQIRSFSRVGHRDDLNPQALIWERAAREFQEELDDALRAYNDGLIPKSEYVVLRLRLRDAITAAQERSEVYRRSGIGRQQARDRLNPRRGRRF